MITWAVIAIILMGGFYYLGYHNGKNSVASSSYAGAAGARGTRSGAGGMAGAGAVTGTVLAKDNTSITVQSRDGSSKIVLYSGSTQFAKSTSGTIDDVAIGGQVVIIGKTNSDGSITAQSVQIRPNMPNMNQTATTTQSQ